MKKVSKLFLSLTLIFTMITPLTVKGITLGEYESKLASYKKQAQDNKNAINNTQFNIDKANKEIENLKSELIQLGNEIGKLNEEIENYNEKIKNKMLESQQILEHLQLASNNNVYIEYIFKASSVSDLMYRTMVIKELIEYNNNSIDDMKKIISGNKNREVEIDKRKQEINNKQDQLSGKITSLGEQKDALNAAGVTVAEQIKIYDELVTSYKKLGCKSSDVIGVDCAVSGDAGVFRRPTQTGYITQEAYYTKNYTHRGLDIGSYRKKSEKIYPIANGTIVAKYKDYYGALVIAVEHYSSVKNSWYTSVYAHLDSYAPGLYVGKKVTSDQYLGYMGETGYSFGVHLHLEVFPCRMYNFGDKNCSNWNNYVSFGTNLLRKGNYKGPRSVITFPTGTYRSWTSR